MRRSESNSTKLYPLTIFIKFDFLCFAFNALTMSSLLISPATEPLMRLRTRAYLQFECQVDQIMRALHKKTVFGMPEKVVYKPVCSATDLELKV